MIRQSPDSVSTFLIFPFSSGIVRQERAGEDIHLPVPVIDDDTVLGEHETGIGDIMVVPEDDCLPSLTFSNRE